MSGHKELEPGHFHHWEPEQAYQGSKFGMWLFLATEIHLFGGMFCLFAFYRWKYLDHFNEYARELNWKLGAFNTFLLLTSSFFMVLAVDSAQKGLNKRCGRWLIATILCALGFLVVKYFEYSAKFHHGLLPDLLSNEANPGKPIFFGLYFAMTGIHGVHVLGGIGLITWLFLLSKKNRFSKTYYTPVELVGLYWHLVDIIWIFLFPIVYLLGGIHI
jgi:cytochrome c oxidase subunit 3